MKRKKVWLMAGPPGSGKSTYACQRVENDGAVWCSRDIVRFRIVSEDEEYFSHEDEVFETWIAEIQYAIDNAPEGTDIYADATHLNERSRNKTINALNLKDCKLCVINFYCSLETCLMRNRLRSGRAEVPTDVVKKMWNAFVPARDNKKYHIIKNV